MKEKINAYFAVLLITIAGSGASLLIIHVANANALSIALGSEATYAALDNSTPGK